MKIHNIKDFKNGWMIGNFEPTMLKTENFEIAHHHYCADFVSQPHIHKVATEYNYILKGLLEIEGQLLESGKIFVFEPGEFKQVRFIYDTDLIIIKTPSIPTDKYLI